MKLFYLLAASFFLFTAVPAHAAGEARTYEASGEVTSADPLYRRVTIKHGRIKDFAGPREDEFVLEDAKAFKGIARRDLVKFTFTERGGDLLIGTIERTGVAEPEEKVKLGTVVQGALESTGGAAKAVTGIVPGAGEVVGGTVDATTGATGSVLNDASPEVKTEF